MGHESDQEPTGTVDAERADRLASTLAAIAEPLRVRILTALREGPATPAELGGALAVGEAELAGPLDRLVELGLVGREDERPGAACSLADDHVESLLDEAIGHDEHRRRGLDDRAVREL